MILITFLFSPILFSAPSIVYDSDNRTDIIDLKDIKLKELSLSVAGQINHGSYKITGGIAELINPLKLSSPYGLKVCSDERFADQISGVNCTGFLVGEDLLLTAGHCSVPFGETVKNKNTSDCRSNSWLFDYKIEKNRKANMKSISTDNIYGCKEVIVGAWSHKIDYSLLRLDRKVPNFRKPLKVDFENTVHKGDKIFVMGHPSGLPLKYAGGAEVFKVDKDFFSANLDTFAINSGSPVFNQDTLRIIGILVRGAIDYYQDSEPTRSCLRANVCDYNGENCLNGSSSKLEEVQQINFLKAYLKQSSRL